MCARTLWPLASSTRNIALGSASTTAPSISMTPSFFAITSSSCRLPGASDGSGTPLPHRREAEPLTWECDQKRPTPDSTPTRAADSNRGHAPNLSGERRDGRPSDLVDERDSPVECRVAVGQHGDEVHVPVRLDLADARDVPHARRGALKVTDLERRVVGIVGGCRHTEVLAVDDLRHESLLVRLRLGR